MVQNCTPYSRLTKVRRARMELTNDDPTIILPFPSDSEWKRAINRHKA
jgi:hypothetical protein